MGFMLSGRLSAKNVGDAISLVNQLREGRLIDVIDREKRDDIIILDCEALTTVSDGD